MKKRVLLSGEARRKLLDGVEILADSVTSTLGPYGRNVIIEQEQGNPVSTKDGVTVARSIELEDPIENIGAQLVKQASIRTAEKAGDGTTTSTLLAYWLYGESMNYIVNKTVNSVELKREIEAGTKKVIKFLKELAVNVKNEDDLRQVATVSANGDKEVGELIATSLEKVGIDGIVTVEESRTGETYLETVEGIQFNRGFKSPYFVTDNNLMQSVLKSPYILITDKRITQAKDLIPILEVVSSESKSILIIADDIDGEALSTLVVNKMRGTLNVCAVKAPGFGDKKKELLEDIATLTGGTVISQEKGLRLDKCQLQWLGRAQKITVGKEETTIVDAKGNEESILTRAQEIKAQIDASTSPYEKEQLQDRLAKFSGGVSIVHVGGYTELELLEKKDRVEDALHATKAAVEEGIVPGGGTALVRARESLNPSLNLGEEILHYALSIPFEKILQNAGVSAEKSLESLEKLETKDQDSWTGIDVNTLELINMKEVGIVDPLKVVRMALENAVSVAGTMLITEAVVYNVEKKKENNNLENYMQ